MHWSIEQDTIETRLTREYGLRHPFVSAGMGFVAHPALAAAVSNAGGLGVLGVTPDPPQSLPVMAGEVRELTSGSWGVDLICADTGFGPACTDEHVDGCVQLQVPLVVFHHNPPRRDWVERLDAAGIPVWMQVSSAELAEAAAGLGIAGLVAQGAEAGGHSRATIPLHDLLGGLRERHPGRLLLAAGGVTDGADAAAAIRAGADGVWVGTRLVASAEAAAHPEYQRRIVEAGSRPLTTTAFGPEWPAQSYRLLPTPAVAEWAGREDQIPAPPPGPATIGHTTLFPHSAAIPYEMPKFSAVPPGPGTTGDWDEMAYPAGDGVSRIRDVTPAAEIISDMMTEARELLSGERAAAG